MNQVTQNTQNFQKRIEKLNPEQRRAVESTEGPVMVIAGPGTGKTEVLAARIAHILSQPLGAAPHNILCLTFTDAATIAMRNRLLEFIGPDAYKVQIHTFHSFCNEIIQQNLDYFGKRELTLVSELEMVEFLEKLIDSFPTDHPLYHVTSYHELPRLWNLFSTIKTENWCPNNDTSMVSDAIESYIADLPNREAFTYKRANSSKGISAGDPNPRLINAEKEKMTKLLAALQEFPKYQQWLEKNKRFDYADMIQWVIGAFKENDNLLAQYQEQFLYVLVDEYQDTNGSQNEIITLLTSFWESPNVFIVGDDDQSIFRFQGANLRNIMDFYSSHKENVQSVVISKNYRSSTNILNAAEQVISHNDERLVNEIPNLTKELTAENESVSGFSELPAVTEYYNISHEEAGIVERILTLQSVGVSLDEVAVIYREHRQAEHIIKLFEEKGVPLNVKESTDILQLPLTKMVMSLLSYIENEHKKPYSAEDQLFHLLHYPFFKVNTRDIAVLSALRQRERNLTLRELISTKETGGNISETFTAIEELISLIPQVTLAELIEAVFTKLNVLDYVMSSEEKFYNMRVLTTFFNFVKDEARKSPQITLSKLLETLHRMESHSIRLPLNKMTYAKEGVSFLTAHSSKGLEFDHVFVIGCNAKVWDRKKGSRNQFSFPDTLTLSTSGNDIEETRRLFFVALTRAKRHLYISYAAKDHNDKPLEASRFIAELRAVESLTTFDTVHMPNDVILRYHRAIMTRANPKNTQIIEHAHLNELLKNYKLSPTHLNKYMRCPIAFYFENVLRVPAPLNEYMGFGNAIHYALEHYFRNASKNGNFGETDSLLNQFETAMNLYRSSFTENQYKKRMEYGRLVLTAYFNKNRPDWNLKSQVEYRISKAVVGGVPVTGKIDKIEFVKSSIAETAVHVVDYKTGSFKNAKERLERPSEKNPLGGDYWRQIVFYNLILDADPYQTWQMASGEMDFVEADKAGEFYKASYAVTPEDKQIVSTQIAETYKSIVNHEFEHGCEECSWCEFVRQEHIHKATMH